MIIVYCSKPQQTDAVTPTPLTHRSHTCMRALALGHDTDDTFPPEPPPRKLTDTQPSRRSSPGTRNAPDTASILSAFGAVSGTFRVLGLERGDGCVSVSLHGGGSGGNVSSAVAACAARDWRCVSNVGVAI